MRWQRWQRRQVSTGAALVVGAVGRRTPAGRLERLVGGLHGEHGGQRDFALARRGKQARLVELVLPCAHRHAARHAAHALLVRYPTNAYSYATQWDQFKSPFTTTKMLHSAAGSKNSTGIGELDDAALAFDEAIPRVAGANSQWAHCAEPCDYHSFHGHCANRLLNLSGVN